MNRRHFTRPQRKRSLPNLSEGQETAIFGMLTLACQMAARTGLCDDSTAAKDTWRRSYLMERLGNESLRAIPRVGSGFAQAMGALQEVACTGIEWIMQAGATQPEKLVWHVRHMIEALGVPEHYIRGLARNALKLDRVPDLDELDAPQLSVVARIVHAQGARIASAASAGKVKKGGNPF